MDCTNLTYRPCVCIKSVYFVIVVSVLLNSEHLWNDGNKGELEVNVQNKKERRTNSLLLILISLVFRWWLCHRIALHSFCFV